jgi:hypothetical protein
VDVRGQRVVTCCSSWEKIPNTDTDWLPSFPYPEWSIDPPTPSANRHCCHIFTTVPAGSDQTQLGHCYCIITVQIRQIGDITYIQQICLCHSGSQKKKDNILPETNTTSSQEDNINNGPPPGAVMTPGSSLIQELNILHSCNSSGNNVLTKIINTEWCVASLDVKQPNTCTLFRYKEFFTEIFERSHKINTLPTKC